MEVEPLLDLIKTADPLLRTLGLLTTFALVSYRAAIWGYAATRQMIKLIYTLRTGTPQEVRQVLDEKPPEVPKGTGLIAFGALAISATLAVHSPLAARMLGDRSSCPKKCPDGQECVDGGNGRRYCGKLARPASDASPPESAVSFSETPSYYRRTPFDE